MNFQESEAYLLSLGNEVAAMKLGLENITRLLAALGDPQTKYLKVQVAGTNGKGSVCAFLRSICLEAGIHAGVFTSPHLVSITERVSIGGVDIAEDEFARVATIVRETSERLVGGGGIDGIPTFFEQVTAIALLAFAEADVKLAILETGLGGRLDATTVAKAEIAAITRIDYDHQEYLGDTIEKIAAEKSAIIHKDCDVVISQQIPEVMKILLDRCNAVGIEVITGEGGNSTGREGALAVSSVSGAHSLPLVFPPLGLRGRHQAENAAIAIRIAELLNEFGLKVTPDSIDDGLRKARHPGRLEYDCQFLFDGAHNEGGARALREFLDEFEKRPITLVFGAMRGKDVGSMTEMLFAKADHIILTRPDNERAMPVEELRQFAPEMIFAIDSVEAAIGTALDVAGEDGIILVTGSLYLVGDVKRILKSQI